MKAKTMHTPGPWRYGNSSKNLDQFFVGNNDYTKSIALIDSFHVEHEANAKLIAAAPELLEACKLAIDELKESATALDGQSHETMIKILEAAIAKAEGR